MSMFRMEICCVVCLKGSVAQKWLIKSCYPVYLSSSTSIQLHHACCGQASIFTIIIFWAAAKTYVLCFTKLSERQLAEDQCCPEGGRLVCQHQKPLKYLDHAYCEVAWTRNRTEPAESTVMTRCYFQNVSANVIHRFGAFPQEVLLHWCAGAHVLDYSWTFLSLWLYEYMWKLWLLSYSSNFMCCISGYIRPFTKAMAAPRENDNLLIY